MPIPSSLCERFAEPAFWQEFFFEAEGVAVVPDVVVELPVGGGCEIVLEVQGRHSSYELGIRTPASTEVRSVGWDDLAHWHPYAFRWSELDLVCRAATVVDASLTHPGPALMLLCRFVSVHDGDDVEGIASVIEAAFESQRPSGWAGYWPNVSDWLAGRDFRGLGVQWHHDSSGNLYATQDIQADQPFYSMRGEPTEDPAGFPYVHWRDLMAAAGRTLST